LALPNDPLPAGIGSIHTVRRDGFPRQKNGAFVSKRARPEHLGDSMVIPGRQTPLPCRRPIHGPQTGQEHAVVRDFGKQGGRGFLVEGVCYFVQVVRGVNDNTANLERKGMPTIRVCRSNPIASF